MSSSVIWRNEGSVVAVPGTGDLSGSWCLQAHLLPRPTLSLRSGLFQLQNRLHSPGLCPSCSPAQGLLPTGFPPASAAPPGRPLRSPPGREEC